MHPSSPSTTSRTCPCKRRCGTYVFSVHAYIIRFSRHNSIDHTHASQCIFPSHHAARCSWNLNVRYNGYVCCSTQLFLLAVRAPQRHVEPGCHNHASPATTAALVQAVGPCPGVLPALLSLLKPYALFIVRTSFCLFCHMQSIHSSARFRYRISWMLL